MDRHLEEEGFRERYGGLQGRRRTRVSVVSRVDARASAREHVTRDARAYADSRELHDPRRRSRREQA